MTEIFSWYFLSTQLSTVDSKQPHSKKTLKETYTTLGPFDLSFSTDFLKY